MKWNDVWWVNGRMNYTSFSPFPPLFFCFQKSLETGKRGDWATLAFLRRWTASGTHAGGDVELDPRRSVTSLGWVGSWDWPGGHVAEVYWARIELYAARNWMSRISLPWKLRSKFTDELFSQFSCSRSRACWHPLHAANYTLYPWTWEVDDYKKARKTSNDPWVFTLCIARDTS